MRTEKAPVLGVMIKLFMHGDVQDQYLYLIHCQACEKELVKMK